MKHGKHFEITTDGPRGNAFFIMGEVMDAMKKVGLSETEEYINDATSSDYNHLWEVSCKMIDRCDNEYKI